MEKNYINEAIESSSSIGREEKSTLLSLNVMDIYKNLSNIYNESIRNRESFKNFNESDIKSFWSLANEFNITTNNFDSLSLNNNNDVEHDYPNTFFGKILEYHLRIVKQLDQIIQMNYSASSIEKSIDYRRKRGWITSIKLKEFTPITKLIHGSMMCDQHSFGFNLNVLIFVITKPNDFQLRTVIRQTWAKKFIENTQQIRLYFPIGQSKSHNDQSKIDKEYIENHDIIQWSYIESYRYLTIKSLALIRWSSIYCPLVKNIFKVDGDSLVNYENFQHFLHKITQKNVSSTNLNFKVYGFIHDSSCAFRTFSKFATSFDDYPYVYYPKYSDANYLLSGYSLSLLTYSTAILSTMPALPWEDVYITGLVPKRMIDHYRIDYRHELFPGYDQHSNIDDIDLCNYNKSVIFTHEMNANNLPVLWKHLWNNSTGIAHLNADQQCEFVLN